MSKVAAAVLGGLALAPSFVAPGQGLRGAQPHTRAQGDSSSLQGLGHATGLGAAAVCLVASQRRVGLKAFDPSSQVGATAPLGFFDPAGHGRRIRYQGPVLVATILQHFPPFFGTSYLYFESSKCPDPIVPSCGVSIFKRVADT